MDKADWRFVGTSGEGGRLRIRRTNVWSREWRRLGIKATVKDPLYRQTFEFDVYEIETKSGPTDFAAGEFSNGMWGFYVRGEPGTAGHPLAVVAGAWWKRLLERCGLAKEDAVQQ
jgi:hypothetical protein